MKILLGLLLPLIFSGVANPPLVDSEILSLRDETILVDTTNIVYSKIKASDVDGTAAYFETNGVDTIGSDSSLNLLVNNYQVIPDRKSILGFDAPQMSEIDRLTLRIQYRTYEKWDLFRWFPKNLEDNFVLSSTGHSVIWNFAYFKNATGISDLSYESYVSTYAPNVIGTYEDLVAFQSVVNELPYQNGYAWSPNFMDNPVIGDNVMPVSSTGLKDRGFYVILPVYYDMQRCWISVAGTTIDDEYISDGLDNFGNATTTTIGDVEYKYIDMNFNNTSARGVYFNNRSTINQVQVSGTGLATLVDVLSLGFGTYDFVNSEFTLLITEFDITTAGSLMLPIDAFIVLSDQVAVVNYVPDSDIVIRIIYTSTGSAVLTNIVDQDGFELPIDITPDTTTDFDIMIGGWSGIIDILMVALRIALVGLLAFLLGYIVFVIIKAISNKNDKNNTRRHYRGKR